MLSAKVIKFEGEKDALVWKHPEENFDTTTQLIVNESQEAIFFRNGQALDLFEAGRYTLETGNLPILKNLLSIPTKGRTPFRCEVYFINKTMPLDLKWGTRNQFQVLDPYFKILLHVGASGGMGVQILDSRKFLVKLVGTRNVFDKDTLVKYFRERIVTRTKTYLNVIMGNINFAVVNSHLDDISSALQDKLNEDLKEFGVTLVDFFVSTIKISEKDYEEVQGALSAVSRRGIEGYSWIDEQIATVAQKYAANVGAPGSISGMMVQTPMALALGSMLSEKTKPFLEDMFSDMPTTFDTKSKKHCETESNEKGRFQGVFKSDVNRYCSKCGAPLDENANFCSLCGHKIQRQTLCSQCGKKFSDKDVFCSNCGKRREDSYEGRT